MKAKEWLKRGEASTNQFDAFSNYWRGFNNLFTGKGQERKLISEFLRLNIKEEFAQYLLETYKPRVVELISKPVIDMRGNGKDTLQDLDNFHVGITALEKLVALFMIIYQVRCNFEHGQKSPSNDRDLLLCEAASSFVFEVLKHCTQNTQCNKC